MAGARSNGGSGGFWNPTGASSINREPHEPREMDLPQKIAEGENTFGETPKGTGGTPVPPRQSVQTVDYLHRLLGGDARVEAMILRFIAARYGAKNLLHLPPHVAKQILKRPADFIQAAKRHCEPELQF